MSQSSSGVSGCLGCLGTLFFFIFVLPSLISGLIAVFQGKATFGLKNCSFKVGNGVGLTCNPEITAKYQFLNITNLENRKKAIVLSVQELHARIGQGQCQTIYDQASEVLKKDNKPEDFLKSCENLHQAFGNPKSFEPVGWEWLPADESSNEYVRVYAKASSVKLLRNEVLVWQIKDDKAFLASYGYEVLPAESKSR